MTLANLQLKQISKLIALLTLLGAFATASCSARLTAQAPVPNASVKTPVPNSTPQRFNNHTSAFFHRSRIRRAR